MQVRRRRPVPVRAARQHRFERRRPEAARRQGPRDRLRRSARWSRRSGRRPAAARRWAARRSASSFLDAGPQGLPHRREAPRTRHPPLRRRAHRFGREPGRLGQGSRRQHEDDRRHLPRGLRRSPRDYGERLAAEGEICWGGMHSWKQHGRAARAGRPPEDARLPGRHGAHAALHARATTRRRIASCPRTSTGRDPARSTTALQDDDRRAAPVDDRLPRRAERRHGEGLRHRTTRPAATACRTIPTASSTSSATPASGCATSDGKLDAGASSTSAGTAACSPTTMMMQPRTWNDILATMIAVRDAHGWD